MNISISAVIESAWMTLAAVWLVGLAFTKRTVRSQAIGPRIFYLLVALLGFMLLGRQSFNVGWLAARIVPASLPAEWIGAGLTVLGCMFAIWSRITLGGNWSGRATVKENHELVRTGPYAVARHPIYAGLLLAAVGSGIAVGEARCALGFVLLLIAFFIKMSQEERLMREAFPEAYPAYRRRVKALIPGVF